MNNFYVLFRILIENDLFRYLVNSVKNQAWSTKWH